MFVAVHLLHAGPPFVRARSLRAHRSGPRGAEVASHPRPSRGWVGASHGDRPARSASDDGESPARAGLRASQDQARSRRDRREPAATTARCLIGAEGASAESASGRPFSRAVAGFDRSRMHNVGTGTRSVRKRACRGRVRRSSRSRPNTTKCSSLSLARRIRSCARRRISCGTASPDGDVAEIFDRGLTLLLAELRKTKHAASARPRTTSGCASHARHIPAPVRREVWARDDGQCAFVGAAGRCTERGFLEYHHVVPFADGGATSADNLELRCRAHNAYEAERWFGVREEDLVRERGQAWA